MAGILGAWRNGFSSITMLLIAIFMITFMLADRTADQAHKVRVQLSAKVADEVVTDAAIRKEIIANVSALPVTRHTIGEDAPYSRKQNPDTPFLDATHQALTKAGVPHANSVSQQFRSLYSQMMMPVMLKEVFNPILIGLFTLMLAMLLLSTDDSRIFNASSTIIQDLVIPFRKKPLSMEQHLKYLKLCSLGVTIFFFIVSMFFAQIDYIYMFTTIMCAVWTGAAGPIIIGGLYTRFGTTCGAWCALIFGSGTSIAGLACQRNWAKHIYPFLDSMGWVEPIGNFFETVSAPFNPIIVWEMSALKFPINSQEIYFMSMMLEIGGYVVGSLLSSKEPFNLDRMLHRGQYGDTGKPVEKTVWTPAVIIKRMVGIDSEYTTGDKVIAWSVFGWSIVFKFVIMFLGGVIWNLISPWSREWWGVYFFITTIMASLIMGGISTVWFMIGGLIHMKQLFRDLEARGEST